MSKYFIMCERDAGLFSLIQQVIANLPRALNNNAIPVVFFGRHCCYWIPNGYQGRNNVWEYYFEPVVNGYGSTVLPEEVIRHVKKRPIAPDSFGERFDDEYYLSSNFGDHSGLRKQCLQIPFKWGDPDPWLRRVCSRLIKMFIRPRGYLQKRVADYAKAHFADKPIIGLHIRGTDAISSAEPRLFRKNSLVIERYLKCLAVEKQKMPDACIFVATDSVDSLQAIEEVYGDEVISSSTIMHREGSAAGTGPTGGLMPSYIATSPEIAAENGAEAVVDYLLLQRCDILIHNGASLARTVLLSQPDMPHINTHRPSLKMLTSSISLTPYSLRRMLQKCDERVTRKQKIRLDYWQDFLESINNSSL